MSHIKIEAVVKFNSGEAYVFNRDPSFLYEKVGNLLIAKDGPFEARFCYEKPKGRSVAFAGRKFSIPMIDGSKTEASGQWWRCINPELDHITYETIKGLLSCYVFTGCDADPAIMAELRAAYDGPVYPYYDYEKVINYTPERHKLWDKITNLEKAKRSLTKAVIEKAREVKKLHHIIQEYER